MKRKTIPNALGPILIAFGMITFTPIIVAVVEKEYNSILPFVVSGCCAVVLGIFFLLRKKGSKTFDGMRSRDGLLVVTFTWGGDISYRCNPLSFLRTQPGGCPV